MIIHNPTNAASRRTVAILSALALVSAICLPFGATAQTITMNDSGSTATIDPYSSAGMNSWTVNGQNQLNQQWFWYQTSGGIAQPINTISATPTITTYMGATGINEVTAVYQNSQISVSVDYFLTGGGPGSGNADITESIIAKNVSGATFNLNFYQYSYFNLLGGASHDTVSILGGPGSYNFVQQANGSTAIQEAVTAPDAMFAEAAFLGQTTNELATIANLQLNGTNSAGPGQVTWALQWQQELADGQEFDLTKDKSISIHTVPEPSTLALLALGTGVAGMVLRRKKV